MEVVIFDEKPGEKSIFNPKVPEESDIEPGSWSISSTNLYTTAITECVGFVAHNAESRKGLMAHLMCPATRDRGVFEASLQDLRNIGDPSSTQLYLVGGAPEITGGLEKVQEVRDYTEMRAVAYLSELGLPRKLLNTLWAPDRTASDLTLDCPYGDLIIVRHPARDGTENYGI